jgi:RNA polymerase sigma-70 factor (ECF subfamily)
MEPALSPVTGDLIGRAIDGEEDASDRLVALMYPLVAAGVRRHIRRSADHEDVIQEVFAKMFLKLTKFRGDSPFEHWVSRMTVTTCYDWLRKLRARPLQYYADLSEPEAEIVERTLSGSFADDPTPERESVERLLDKLLQHLNPREQIVIRLLDLEELTVKEAQELTGWSASKIKSAAMRGRRKLAERLRRLEGRSPP